MAIDNEMDGGAWEEIASLLKDIELLLKHVIWRIREQDGRFAKKRRQNK